MRDGARELSQGGQSLFGGEVSARGDLANWYVPGGQTGVGGPMDLVQGARRVCVAMERTDRVGRRRSSVSALWRRPACRS